MNEPYFRTIVRYTMTRGDGKVLADDNILLESNGEYVRVAIADPSLCRQLKVIQIPIEVLLEPFK